MNIQFATTNLLINQPPMYIGTTLKERRAILRTVFEATANFSISKKKKKKSNNPVKQTTPKTGILHEPTTQGRRSQRRNKKKKKRKSSKRIFSKICKRYLASSKSRSGPARVTNLSRASFLFFLYTSPPSPLPEQKNVARIGEAVGGRCAKSTRVSKGKRKSTKGGDETRGWTARGNRAGGTCPSLSTTGGERLFPRHEEIGSPPRVAERIRRGLAAGVGPRVVFHLYIPVLV